jgi:hypothetical protein
MRSSLFILSLSFLATMGWGIHSRLHFLSEKTIIDLSSINKNMKVLNSLEEMTIKEIPTSQQYDYLKTDERIAQLNDRLKKVTSVKFEKKIKLTKLAKNTIKRPSNLFERAEVAHLESKNQINENETEASIKLETKDSFEFKLDQYETSDSYALNNYEHEKAFIYVAIDENIQQLQDEVKVAQAAPEKKDVITDTDKKEQLAQQHGEQPEEKLVSNDSEPVKSMDQVAPIDSSDDEIKTFEYSMNEESDEYSSVKRTDQNEPIKEEVITKKKIQAELPMRSVVSTNVAQVINREMQLSPTQKKLESSFENFVDNSGAGMTNSKQPEYSKNTSALNSLTKSQNQNIKTVNTHLTLNASSFSLQDGLEGEIKDFDAQCSVEVNDIKSSVNGEIKYEMILDQKKNFKSLVVTSENHIKTNVNLEILENEENVSVVPLLNALSLEEVLLKKKIEGDGGLLLVKLSPEILGMNLDKKAQMQIALNENLKAIKDESKAAYVLYVGISPGNVMVSIKTENGLSNYLTNVNANELTFDAQPFSKKEKFKIELYNEELMSRNTNPLNLMNEDLSSFGTGKNSSKLTLNSYEFNDELIKTDSQNYYEIKKGEMDLFFGFKNNSKIIIPSSSYQDEVIKVLGIDDSEKSCIVQLNIKDSKNLSSIRSLAYTSEGVESLSMTALDRDGSFGDDISDTTSKIFFKGSNQGSLKIELKYTDDSEESLQTFCSQGVYLVEQL